MDSFNHPSVQVEKRFKGKDYFRKYLYFLFCRMEKKGTVKFEFKAWGNMNIIFKFMIAVYIILFLN